MRGRRPGLAVAGTAAVCAGVLAAGAPGAGVAPATAAPAGSPASLEAAVVAEMNRARAARARPPLRVSATLRRPARAQSAYLAATGALSHESRDGSPFWTRLIAAGYPRERRMAENLALVPGCGGAARRIVALWLASPAHRANLLDRRMRWVGAGVASDPSCERTVITADYGS